MTKKAKGVSLYTASDIKRVKDELVKQQKGIDPILKEPFKEVVATDHDHTSQHIRSALNRNTNAFEGLVTNAYKRCLQWLTDKPLPEILRNLADYLEKDYSHNPYHPKWMKRVAIDFNKLKEGDKDKVLVELGSDAGSNGAERKKLFQKLVLNRDLGYEKIRDTINKKGGIV